MAAEDIRRKQQGRAPATPDTYGAGAEIDPLGRKKNDPGFFFCC
jgi:hypothetical protein